MTAIYKESYTSATRDAPVLVVDSPGGVWGRVRVITGPLRDWKESLFEKQLRLVISLDLIVRSIAVEMGAADLQTIA